MNLFELFVKIGVDDQASNKLKDLSGKLGNGLKTAAKIGTAAVSAAAAGITALTTAAVKNYAQYEQLVGGVDTLFKDASKKVQQYASEAYRTSGMSANDYMENATAFSATLINALGGDTEKAAEYANRAMVSMSDNANKMGTSIDTIVQTYQSLSRGNFAMLDSLKLGYGGTKTELERLIKDAASYTDIQKQMGITVDKSSMSFDNIVNAITVVQGKLGIAGATSAEAATTIEGSVNSMKAAWSNLITGIANENADFEGLIDKFVESVGTVGDNIMPRVQQALLGVQKLVESLIPKIMGSIPKLVSDFLPKILKSGFNIAKSLVKGIKDNAKTIVKSAKDLILNFIDGMVDMLPDVIEGAIELLSGIIEAIPEVLYNIEKNIPKIIEAVVNGLAKGVSSIAKVIRSWFSPVANEVNLISNKLSNLANSFTPFLEAVEDAATKTADLGKALSKNGKTLSELDEEIEETENKITAILKKSFGEQDGLRQNDLKKIKEYQAELARLQAEKLSIYQEQQLAELRKAQLSANNLIVEDAQAALARAQSALQASNDMVEQIYSERLTTIENTHKAQRTINSAAYKKDLDDAKAAYDKMKAQNQSYYDSTVQTINGSANKWVETEANAWDTIGEKRQKFIKENEKIREHYNPFGAEWAGDFNEWVSELFGTYDEATVAYGKMLEEMDEKSTNAFLSMQATAVASGQVLDKETQKSIESILNAYGGLPEPLDEVGRQSLDMLINGLETKIPELQNASEMTTDEILGVLRKNLLGKNGSMEKIGKDSAAGLKKGILSEYQNIVNASVKISNAVLSTMIKTFDIHSPSRVLKDKIGKQIVAGLALGITDYAYLAEDAADNLSRDVSDSFENMDIITTSSSSIGDFTNSNNKSDNSSNKTEFSLTIDDSNSMGLARALLPLLKIAEKEAYA